MELLKETGKAKRKRLINKIIFFVCFIGMYFGPIAQVNAQEQQNEQQTTQQDTSRPPQELSTTISPPSFELTANPGDRLEQVIRITNNSSNTVTYTAEVQKFIVQGLEGSVIIDDEGNVDNTDETITNWVYVDPQEFTLDAGEQRQVLYILDIPENAPPGGHFGSLLFQPKIVQAQEATGAQTLTTTAALIILTVAGEALEKGSVSSFEAETFDGSWDRLELTDGRIIPRPLNRTSESEQRNYFSSGPIALNLIIKNEGNVHWRPQGTVTFHNIFGQKVDEVNVNPLNVFPGGERRITVLWPKENFWGFRYSAKFIAQYGSKNQTISAETSFFAFPFVTTLILFITVITILTILITLRKRLIFAIKVLVGGSEVQQQQNSESKNSDKPAQGKSSSGGSREKKNLSFEGRTRSR